MRLRDRVHDRQPEARRAAAVADAAHEALEDAVLEVGRDARPVVLDRQPDLPVDALDRRPHLGARRGVADRVLDEVERQAVQLVARPVDEGAVGVDRELVAVGDDAELAGRLDEHLAEVGRRVRRLARGVVAGQQQQVGDEPAHAPRRAQRRVGGLLLLAVEALGEQLEVGEHARQRRAQLVRGVGDELALAAQGVLGLTARGVERVEHAVQRAGKLGDLVVGLDGGDLLGRVARALDLARGRRQRGDRRHRAAGDHDPGEQRQAGAAEHADDEKQAQAPDGRVDGRQRARVLQVDSGT